MSSSALRRCHVVIVNYNSTAELIKCVDSMPVSALASVTVLDNASARDERDALVEFAETGKVNLHLSDTNLGFGGGMNAAVRASGAGEGDILWLLNPDTLVSREAIDELVAQVESRPRSIVSPLILTGDSVDEYWFSGGTMQAKAGYTEHWRDAPSSSRGDFTECTFVTGAAQMMSFTTWAELGGYRDDLFLYWEDADLCLRANAIGMTLGVANRARIWHAVGASSASVGKSTAWHYYMQRNRLIVCGDVAPKASLAFGRGLKGTARLLVRALREKEERGARFSASVRGLVSGLRS